MLTVTIRTSRVGNENLLRDLVHKATRTKNLMSTLADRWYTWEASLFAFEGEYDGNPKWAPWSPRYRPPPPGMLLVLTGIFRNSLLSRHSMMALFSLSKTKVKIGSALTVAEPEDGRTNLAMIHQFGRSHTPGMPNMPARPVYLTGPTLLIEFGKATEEYWKV
jgi:phage gpG-like protein